MLNNHGIECNGLQADTMHMARLWDTARSKQGGYSLETLTRDLLKKKYVYFFFQNSYVYRIEDIFARVDTAGRHL